MPEQPDTSSQPAPLLSYTTATAEALTPIPENAHLLQQAADYRSGVRLITASARWDVLWGGLCLLMAAAFYRMQIFSIALLAIGSLLVALGLWVLIKPTPIAMILDGVCLLFFSAANGWWYWHDRGRPQAIVPFGMRTSSRWLLILTAFTLLGAVQRFTRFKRFARASIAPPSKETLAWLQAMHRLLHRASPASDDAMIRFDSSNFPPMSFKAELLPTGLAACLVNNTRLQFHARPNVSITPIGPAAGKRKLKVAAQLGEKSSRGFIRADLFERFQAWKAQDAELEEDVILQADEEA